VDDRTIMEKEFVIDNSIALEGKGFYYDLHNCYQLKEMDHDSKSALFTISFEKLDGDWIKEEDPKTVRMRFVMVFDVIVSPDFYKNSPRFVDELGYKNQGDDDYDFLLTEEQSIDNDDFVIRFTNDDYIRISAKRIEVSADPNYAG
jgi:hypothetical protein